MNCRSHPADTLYEATDLAAITGLHVAPEFVFEPLKAALANRLDIWAEGAGFETIRAEWLSLAAGLGGRISVARRSDTIEGLFRTIDASGRLILEQSTGQVVVEAGDVFLLAQPESARGGSLAHLQAK